MPDTFMTTIMDYFSAIDPIDLLSVIWIDIILSGDNALIIGLAAASLPRSQARRAILIGLALATVMRILFAGMATYLLDIPGLLFFGGLLLFYVAWSLFGTLRTTHSAPSEGAKSASNMRTALRAIIIADISMSLDNVIAVASIARDDFILLVFGLALSIALMGIGSALLVKLLQRFPVISYLGVALLIYIGGEMLLDGYPDFAALIAMIVA